MNELALFAGAGGGILGGRLLGWRTVCAVELDEYARSVLLARQDDKSLEPFPVWEDITTFDGRPWAGLVDVVSGGFPCQDISSAGKKAGIEGERSGLWGEMARVVGEVRPRYVFVENSPELASRGLGVVLGDLAEMGFHAEWGVLGACHAGAPHERLRIWITARHPDRDGESTLSVDEQVARLRGDSGARDVPDAHGTLKRQTVGATRRTRREREPVPRDGAWTRESEPGVVRVDDGMAGRMDRLRCAGNGQVPAVAALAWRELYARLHAEPNRGE